MDSVTKWSPEAIEDIQSIAEYIARSSKFYARAVVSKILNAAREIPDHALPGRIVPEFSDESIRERFVYSYRLVYKIENATITIVAVLHGKRLLEDITDRLDKPVT